MIINTILLLMFLIRKILKFSSILQKGNFLAQQVTTLLLWLFNFISAILNRCSLCSEKQSYAGQTSVFSITLFFPSCLFIFPMMSGLLKFSSLWNVEVQSWYSIPFLLKWCEDFQSETSTCLIFNDYNCETLQSLYSAFYCY